MSPVRSRTVRLTALALATGTLVAAGATAASADDAAAAPTSYQGSTSSNAISLSVLNGVPGLPAIPGVDTSHGLVSLQLLDAASNLLHDGTGAKPDAASSTVTLLGGTLASLAASGGFSAQIPTASSSLAKPGPNKASGALGLPDPLNAGPLASISVPDMTATSTANPLATSSSATGLDLSALKLSDVVPASALAQFSSGFQTLLSQVTAVQGVISQLNAVPGAGTLVSGLNSSLTAIQSAAQAAYAQITGGALATVNGLVSNSSIALQGSQEVSTAHVELGSISLLGGFASVTGFNNTVTAKAGGTPGSASFIPTVNNGGIGALHVAGATAGIDGSGLEADAGPLESLLTSVPGASAFAPQLSAAVTALQSGLAQLNAGLMGLVTVTADTPSNVKVTSDGTSASGQIDGLALAVNLPTMSGAPSLPSFSAVPSGSQLSSDAPGLQSAINTLNGLVGSHASRAATPAAAPAATQVLGLSIGSATAAAGANAAAAAVAGESTGVLAYTGADLPLAAGIATLLVGAGVAMVARRRRTRSEL